MTKPLIIDKEEFVELLKKYATESIINQETNYSLQNVRFNLKFHKVKKEDFLSNDEIKGIIRKHREKVLLEKYGIKNNFQRKDVIEKISKSKTQTLKNKYGVENVFQLNSIKNKIKKTNMKRLGVEWPIQSKSVQEKNYKTREKNGTLYSSKQEKDLQNFVKQLTSHEVISNSRKELEGYELDIFIPKLNLGIEYNGDYWHSLPHKIKRDKEKKALCEEKGIKLLVVKEFDWINNRKSVEALIESEVM